MKKIYDDPDEGEEPTTSKNKEDQSGPSGVLLWDLSIQRVKEKEESNDSEILEKNVIFLGCRESGKTSIILNYTQEVSKELKPTSALEYRYFRKTKSESSVLKQVGHIWELGEGNFLLKLIDVVVNPENILNTGVVITVDLSRPQEMWNTLETIIDYLKKRIKECVKEASKINPHVKERLRNNLTERLKDALNDKLDPIALPTVIVATKYDLFENMEPDKKKIIIKTLRFVAHFFGAALIFTNNKSEINSKNLKSMLNGLLLDGKFPGKAPQVDAAKPIFVPFGTDSFEAIGLPPLPPSELNDPNYKNLIDLWRHLFCTKFPQEEAKKDPSVLEDFGKGNQFEEPVIDLLKEQKMRELENIREVLQKRRAQTNESTKFQIIN